MKQNNCVYTDVKEITIFLNYFYYSPRDKHDVIYATNLADLENTLQHLIKPKAYHFTPYKMDFLTLKQKLNTSD